MTTDFEKGYRAFSQEPYRRVVPQGMAYIYEKHGAAVEEIVYREFCPYKRGTEPAKRWADGWNAAVDEITNAIF